MDAQCCHLQTNEGWDVSSIKEINISLCVACLGATNHIAIMFGRTEVKMGHTLFRGQIDMGSKQPALGNAQTFCCSHNASFSGFHGCCWGGWWCTPSLKALWGGNQCYKGRFNLTELDAQKASIDQRLDLPKNSEITVKHLCALSKPFSSVYVFN